MFGKVNAGKSSFINNVVAMYQQLFPQDTTRFFCFKQGKIQTLEQAHFDEGFTETTAQIQGVELGKNFVLLDSPGLHSVQDNNGNLTRQFVDSADAVLWLTPSTSPGQVQELDDLKAELEKRKPLLPVITRSDFLDEDWDDEQEQVIQKLMDKEPHVRQAQEEDVFQRLQVKAKEFNLAQVEKPISISVHTYKKVHHQLEQSGLARLFRQMSLLIEQAGQYKNSKAQQIVQNFLRETVLPDLEKIIKPQIMSVKREASNTVKLLEGEKNQIASNVSCHIAVNLYEIINKHKDSRNKQAIVNEINRCLVTKLNEELESHLRAFITQISAVSASLDENSIDNFEDNTIRYERTKGSGAKALLTSGGAAGGAAAGAAIGSMVPGFGTVAGGVIGGLVGGLFGSKAADYVVETEWVEEIVGVRTEALEHSLQEQVQVQSTQIVQSYIDGIICRRSNPI